MKVASIINRFKKAKNKHGISGLPKQINTRIRITMKNKWRSVFNDYNHVWVCDERQSETILPEGITIEHYQKLEEIPRKAVDKMVEELGDSASEWLNKEFSEKSVLWLLYVNGEFVARQFIRHGKYFDKWFIPIRDKDYVFMAAGTFPEFRGQGLSPLLKRAIMYHETRNGGLAYVDCKVWNQPAIRALKKNNFRHLATMRNYWEGDSVKERIKIAFKKLVK